METNDSTGSPQEYQEIWKWISEHSPNHCQQETDCQSTEVHWAFLSWQTFCAVHAGGVEISRRQRGRSNEYPLGVKCDGYFERMCGVKPWCCSEVCYEQPVLQFARFECWCDDCARWLFEKMIASPGREHPGEGSWVPLCRIPSGRPLISFETFEDALKPEGE